MWSITSIKLDTQHIIIDVDDFWYQEDIDIIQKNIFSFLVNTNVLENIIGADRQNIRFSWQTQYNFILNFDCYSQSCWLEAENELSKGQLPNLMNELKIILGC